MHGKKAVAPKSLKNDETDKNHVIFSKVTVNMMVLVLLLADSCAKTVCKCKEYFVPAKKYKLCCIHLLSPQGKKEVPFK